MKKKNNERGFTLAELLIVVAIIAVLVAISIPIFNSKLEAAREATDVSNLRGAYALAQAEALTDQPASTVTKYYDIKGDWAASATAASKGKGTSISTGTNYQLPANCTYTTGDDCTGRVIEVQYDKDGVKSCKFVTPS